MSKLEKRMEGLHRELEGVESQLAAPDIYANESKSKLQSVLAEQIRIKRELESAESEWLDANEKLETLQAQV